MNCYLHTDTPATAFCRSCGRALCAVCQRPAEGTVFCQEHVPQGMYSGTAAAGPAASNPYTAPTPPPSQPSPDSGLQSSPGLAFLLGLIPGVGAIYNGQYVKGLIHAVIFGLLVSITTAADNESGHPFLVVCSLAFYCYMAFEAFHTARKRQHGIPVDEWSSLIGPNRISSALPIGPVALILIGVLFLLQSLHVLDFRVIGRFWPVVLILIGGAMLFARLRRPENTFQSGAASARNPDVVEATRE